MSDRNYLGDRPDEGGELTSNGDDDFVDMFAASTERPIAFAQAYLRFPGKILKGFGQMSDALL